ncbi:MAG: TRAP transporter large permease subunit [Pseudomonadota bacterium]
MSGFILAGDLMMHGGLSRRLVRVCETLVAHVTGGLGMVTVLSATLFAAISGSAPATTAAIGSVMIPEVERRGWRRDFAAALATASGPIGQMIRPPSRWGSGG